MNYTTIRSDELQHHGVLGMKWGVRRYQNPDGSLTPAGEKRYYGGQITGGSSKLEKQAEKTAKKKVGTKSSIKNFNKFEEMSKKEESDARKRGDEKAAKKLAAGRIFMKSLVDQEFLRWSVNQASNMASAKTGKNYIDQVMNFKVDRNDDIGGIVVTIDGVSIEIADKDK